ncbi:helix-turn-helix transcriptional regulator [Fimbriimonas ginsengisoli]|uniref:Transcriptional regulator, AraC family n=1 Tax=Fimbriimonas ginsengisoli Gsoil 348 TaxID=661478 RepID=A0A068NRN2_FIMGI|nr:AraC family transcriptional regulator [Fimbriimonas ginsengisoli]AIE86061.1 transcriptional regulator, AraC family [Fimbriimonas ginsengisoli Gsoil 348]
MRIAPVPIYFEELRDLNAGCVSDRLPILCFEDPAENPDVVRGYLHVDFMSVYVARQGSGVHFVDEEPFKVQAGDVYAMGYGMSHRFENSDGLVLDTVHFVPTMFSPGTQEALSATEGLAPLFLGFEGAGSSRWLRLSKAAHIQAAEMLHEMREEWRIDAPDRALMVQATFLRFLVFLARCHRNTHRSGSRVGSRARALIELRYAEPLKIGDLAASAFLSIGRFTEVFRAEVGCSPREYLGQVRIAAAKKLLRETDLTISSIAARTGFPDPAYFTRFFRQQVGIPPSDFRGD